MSATTAKRLVLVSMLVMGGIAGTRSVTKGSVTRGATYRQIWAVGVLAVALSMLADFAPEIAGPFAGLVALAFVAGGQDTITSVLTGAAARAHFGAGDFGGGGDFGGAGADF